MSVVLWWSYFTRKVLSNVNSFADLDLWPAEGQKLGKSAEKDF